MKTRRGILTALIVVLFAAALITFPYAFNLTWAMPGADMDRTLTYRTGSLTWDSDAEIDANGVIRLSMFRSSYSNVSAEDGVNVLAPGTEKTTRIRLLNTAGGSIRYTAVLYRLDETDVPIFADLSGMDASVTADYALPGGVTAEQVVNAVSGTVGGSSVKTVDIDWKWDYSVDDAADQKDTELGNQAQPDEVQYGLYIVVVDDNYNGGIVPPQTGDDSHMMLWFILAVVSLGVMIFFAIWDKRNEKARKTHES